MNSRDESILSLARLARKTDRTKTVEVPNSTLEARMDRLFGTGLPAGPYKFTQRAMGASNFANRYADFEDSQGNPYSFGGAPGGFSISVPAASYNAFSSSYRSWLYLQNYHAATPLYIDWNEAVSRAYSDTILTVHPIVQTAGLIFEIRGWAVQAPGAADKYYAMRWTWDATTLLLTLGLWYGTGITFTATDGTLICATRVVPSMVYKVRLTAGAGPAAYMQIGAAENPFMAHGGSAVVAGWITSFNCVRWYQPPNTYHVVALDRIGIAA